ncbi:hypothetical protein Tco_0536899 [Tanacetum coccineum]
MEKAQTRSSLAIPITNDEMNIELSEEFLKKLRSNAYFITFDEDVVDHIAKVLEMLSLIKIPNVDSHRQRDMCNGYPQKNKMKPKRTKPSTRLEKRKKTKPRVKGWAYGTLPAYENKLELIDKLLRAFISPCFEQRTCACAPALHRRRSKKIVEPELRTIGETPVATMADTRTMSELLQAPTEGYEYAIVLPPILAKNFELKVGLLQLVTSSQFHGFERDDPHSHICWFNKITSTLKYKNVPHDAIKLMLFPFSLEGAAQIWLEKEPPRSIHKWEDLVYNKAWDHFKDLLRKCPHHGFSELHQIDTFYNALTQSDQDSLNAAAGGNLLNRTHRDALTIIENKSKVHTSRNKLVVSKASTTSSSTPAYLPDIIAL